MVIARRFLAFVETAPWPARAAATTLLARAYVKGSVPADEVASVENAMTAMLDDYSPMVRRALSDVLAPEVVAPRHLIVALASDVGDVAAPVLRYSPLLTTAELVDVVAQGDAEIHQAISQRENVSAPVSAALAEVISAECAIDLVGNTSADILSFSLERLLTRFSDRYDLTTAILARPDTPRPIALLCEIRLARHGLSGGDNGSYYVRGDNTMQDRLDEVVLRLASECADAELQTFVSSLRRFELLNAALVLRAILVGQGRLAAAILSNLGNCSFERSKGVLTESGGSFAALFARAGLPTTLLPVFKAALAHRPFPASTPANLDRESLRSMLIACVEAGVTEADGAVAMLRRLDATLARSNARLLRQQVVTDAFLDEPASLRPSHQENARIQTIADNVAHNGIRQLQHDVAPEPRLRVPQTARRVA